MPPGTSPSNLSAGFATDLSEEPISDTAEPIVGPAGRNADMLKGKAAAPSPEKKIVASKGSNTPQAPKMAEEASAANARGVLIRRSTMNPKSGPSRLRDADKRQRSSSSPAPFKRQNLPPILGLDKPQKGDIVIV